MPAARHAVLLYAISMVACGPAGSGTEHKSTDFHFFVPPDAQNVREQSRQNVVEVAYSVATPYPAGRFICELENAVAHDRWHGLREDFMNPGLPTSLIRGWNDIVNGLKKPETHVHGWSSEWLNDEGELLSYWLRYEYPEGAKPALGTLQVQAVRWPAKVVPALVGEKRASQLASLTLRHADHDCSPPIWSRFVKDATGEADPVFSPSDVRVIEEIQINDDIDGVADRIAETIRAKRPGLRVGTPKEDPLLDGARLNLSFACRCKQPGAPNGFYVTEAVAYKPAISGGKWHEPARVLFHWNDGGDPAWKHVSASCFAERVHSPACLSAFHAADISFTDALVSALGDRDTR
jgi:hypothetical protein